VGIIFVAIVVISLGVIGGLLFLAQGPQYAQSSDHNSKTILEFAQKYPFKRAIDLGSGDGKLVLLLAHHGFTIDGVELNPFLVWKSRRALKNAKLDHLAHIHWGNFWSFNLAPYDLLVVFAIKHIMPRLEGKILQELTSKSYIFSNYFEFKGLKQVSQEGDIKVYRI
jgi:hypothetical protein